MKFPWSRKLPPLPPLSSNREQTAPAKREPNKFAAHVLGIGVDAGGLPVVELQIQGEPEVYTLGVGDTLLVRVRRVRTDVWFGEGVQLLGEES